MLFSGIMSILLGILIIVQWPVSGIWVVGFYVGIRMMMHGWLLMALGRTGQQTLTQLQDTRIEKLEYHIRAGAQALQETQAILADHTAMFVTLDAELRKKVSLSEVDPVIQELNEGLGTARERMRQASEATAEAWDAAQKEAAAEFERLKQNTAGLTKRLKDELGIGTSTAD
jgi:hypothetical protein